MAEMISSIKDFFNLIYSAVAPILAALLGRLTHYVVERERWPTLVETAKEVVIVLFLGITAAGAADWLGLQYSMGKAAFIASWAYYGPRIIYLIAKKIFPEGSLKEQVERCKPLNQAGAKEDGTPQR